MGKVQHNGFIIPLKGLSAGKHNYLFELDSSFFHEYDESLILEARLSVDIVIDRQVLWTGIEGRITGEVVTECDRCLDNLAVIIDTNIKLIAKHKRSEGEEDSDDVMIIDSRDQELDLSQFFYDYVCLALPLQRVHPEGECNKEMLEKLKLLSHKKIVKGGEANLPFSKLKDILN